MFTVKFAIWTNRKITLSEPGNNYNPLSPTAPSLEAGQRQHSLRFKFLFRVRVFSAAAQIKTKATSL